VRPCLLRAWLSDMKARPDSAAAAFRFARKASLPETPLPANTSVEWTELSARFYARCHRPPQVVRAHLTNGGPLDEEA
jgi:hypothetical protein